MVVCSRGEGRVCVHVVIFVTAEVLNSSMQESFRILSPNLPMHDTLFEEINSCMLHLAQELERPRLRNSFLLNAAEVQLTLTDNFLLLASSPTHRPSHFLSLNFAAKFEVVYSGSTGE